MSPDKEIYRRIVSAKLFIDEHFQQSIDLRDVSGKACLSRFHFHRLFKHIYQQTPHAYITRKRLDKAKDLLKENREVTAVCTEVGYESLGSFSILFKKEIGFAPQYYRNMAWMKKQKEQQQPKSAIPHCFIEQYNFDR